MELWKAWFDVRQRFLLCVVLVTLLAAPQTIRLAVASTRPAPTATEAPSQAAPQPAAAFDTYIEGWLRGSAHMAFSILAVVLAVGGILSRSNARSNLMTLSLPLNRGRWLAAQAAMAALLLLALCAWEGSIILLTGWGFGLAAPAGTLALATLLSTVSATIWIWPAILATALTRDAVRAALITISVMVAMLTAGGLLGWQRAMFERVANVYAWRGGWPWEPLLLGVAFAAATAWMAVVRFRRTEF